MSPCDDVKVGICLLLRVREVEATGHPGRGGGCGGGQTGTMSWFNASQLSSFAKQALSQAQKSIDRVLDIKEDETAWADSIITPFQDGKGIPPPPHTLLP